MQHRAELGYKVISHVTIYLPTSSSEELYTDASLVFHVADIPAPPPDDKDDPPPKDPSPKDPVPISQSLDRRSPSMKVLRAMEGSRIHTIYV